MKFTCEKCGWWADVNGVCVCGYSGRPTTRHDSCTAWKTSIVTNADRIRSMTDEELADWLIMNGDGSDYQTWLDWLREECE